jgi:hypothetical protein
VESLKVIAILLIDVIKYRFTVCRGIAKGFAELRHRTLGMGHSPD